MSGRRRRSESLWDRKEDSVPQTEINEKIPSNFHGDGSPKRSNSEGNDDIIISDDFSRQQSREPTDNERHRMKMDSAFENDSYNLPYRGRNRGVVPGGTENMTKDRDRSRSRSRSPHRTRGRDRDRDQDRDRSPLRGGSRFQDDRNFADNPRNKGPDGYRRQSNQSVKTPCRFFIMGNCNRSNCRFSHDLPNSSGYESRSHNNIIGSNSGDNNPRIEDQSGFSDFPNSNPNFDKKNKSWNDPSRNNIESRDFDDFGIASNQFPSTLNRNGVNLQLNGSVDLQSQTDIQNKEDGKLLETSKNDIPTMANTDQVPQFPPNVILANALNLLHSLPNPVDSTQVKVKVNENLEKTEKQGKADEGNIGNDEKAMRQFKVALVEFVKEILKPTWKEGKMSREDYKTIVKKVVEKVTSTIQGIQIPRTQEKIDQYLAFSKSKITKLVEAYVGRFQKA